MPETPNLTSTTRGHLRVVAELFDPPSEVESFYSPSWTMDVELTVHELSARVASGLMDRHVSWTKCRRCGAFRRLGYCAPLVMWGEETCSNCLRAA